VEGKEGRGRKWRGKERGGKKKSKGDCQFRLFQLTRSSSADEIANVNFFDDDIVHVLQNTIVSRINSATMYTESQASNKKSNDKARHER